MDFLVMLEESPEHSPVLARVDSVPAALDASHQGRDVVTLYGIPNPDTLALALAAALESRRSEGESSGVFRHLGLWPERGAVGDSVWRDDATGELMTRDLDIPLEVLSAAAHDLLDAFGTRIRRLVANLSMPDWPENAWRAIGISFEPVTEPTRAALSRLDDLLDDLRVADGLTYEYEGD